MIKFLRKYTNFKTILLIVITLLTLLVIYTINRQGLTTLKTPKPDIVFSPTDNTFIHKNRGYFELINSININYLEKLIYNWQIFFDLFALNPKLQSFASSVNFNTLKSITDKVKQSPKEFFKGSSDDILKEYGDVIRDECKYYKLDYRLILAIMKQESAFTSDAVSRAGAYGFMQIMPKTGSSLEGKLQIEDFKLPKNNIIAGIYYFALLVGRYDGVGEDKFKFALAGYNAGSGRVEDAMSIVYYNKMDYKKWDNVREALKLLGSENDSLHTLIWNSKPPNGYFSNWKEPVNYVDNVIYYWNEYKKIYKKSTLND